VLCFDAADRLVESLVAHGAIETERALADFLCAARVPGGVAVALRDVLARDRRLLDDGATLRLAPSPLGSQSLEDARVVVVDLETTGLVPGAARIRELGAVLLEAGAPTAELELRLRSRDEEPEAVSCLLELAGEAVLAGHNLRFDVAFLEWPLRVLRGERLALPLVDTLPLARRLLHGRTERLSLHALGAFFGTGAEPCHRALPDARATAEVLLRLVELARERGARTVGDLCALARTAVPSPAVGRAPVATP